MLSDSAKEFGMESSSEFQRLLEVVRGFGYELSEGNEWIKKLGDAAEISFDKFKDGAERARVGMRDLMREGGGFFPGGGGRLPEYQYGTPYVPRTGTYLLHQGEAVIPASQTRGGMGQPQVINLYVDNHVAGNKVQRVLFKIIQEGSKDGRFKVHPSVVREW